MQDMIESEHNDLMVSHNLPTPHEMSVYSVIAQQAVESKMYKGVGDMAGVMMIMLAARELNIPPMQALNGGLYIINGKVEISARMMGAMIRRSGQILQTKESTETSCTLFGRRVDTGETATVTYTLAEAQKAGLVKAGGAWTKIPKDMCYARCLSRLARQLWSDIIGIGYMQGEIKPMECEVIPTEEKQNVTTDRLPEEKDLIDKYMSLFDDEDKYLAAEYLSIGCEHFGHDKITMLTMFMEDEEKLIQKFKFWKHKRA